MTSRTMKEPSTRSRARLVLLSSLRNTQRSAMISPMEVKTAVGMTAMETLGNRGASPMSHASTKGDAPSGGVRRTRPRMSESSWAMAYAPAEGVLVGASQATGQGVRIPMPSDVLPPSHPSAGVGLVRPRRASASGAREIHAQATLQIGFSTIHHHHHP